jgi:hypothetical protein
MKMSDGFLIAQAGSPTVCAAMTCKRLPRAPNGRIGSGDNAALLNCSVVTRSIPLVRRPTWV